MTTSYKRLACGTADNHPGRVKTHSRSVVGACRDCRLAECALPSGLDGCDQRLDAEDGDHSFEIISEDVEAGLGSDVLERFHEEVRRPHSGFERTKRVFYGLSTDPHCIRPAIEAPAHRFDDRLMFPSFDPALLTGRALVMESTCLAVRTPVTVERHVGLDRTGPTVGTKQ